LIDTLSITEAKRKDKLLLSVKLPGTEFWRRVLRAYVTRPCGLEFWPFNPVNRSC